MVTAEEFILRYIQKKYTIPEGTDVFSLNYIEQGYIDSLGLIKFIVDLEDEFNIEFTDDDRSIFDFMVPGTVPL